MVALAILAVPGLRCWGLPLASVSGLTAEASLAGRGAPGAGLQARGSRRGAPGSLHSQRRCLTAYLRLACEIFLDQGLNQCILGWQAASLPLSHQGSLTNGISATFHIPPPKGQEVFALFLLIYF